MCLLSWWKTNFLCIISILSRKSMSKLINVNCLHFTGCLNYTNVLINHVLCQIKVTALLPFFLSILHLLLQLSKIMFWSTVKLLLAIVMSIIFGPLKLFRGHRKVRNFQGSQVSSFDFSTLYTSLPRDLIKAKGLSLVNWCFNLTSVLHLRQDSLATRNMTRIDVGLARSYVKLLLSSWKTYMCNWWHGISTNSGDSYGHLLCSTYSRFIFILLWEGLYVWPSKMQTSWPHRHV